MKPGVWAGAVLMIVLITESAAPLTYAELKAASFDPLVEQLRHFPCCYCPPREAANLSGRRRRITEYIA